MTTESMDRSEVAKVFSFLIIAFLQLETSSTTAQAGCRPESSCITLAPTPMSKQSTTIITQFSKSSTRQGTVPIPLSTTVSPNRNTAFVVSSTIQATETVTSSYVSVSGTQSSVPGCISDPLGMARRTIIPDSDITSSTALNSASDASEARLGNNAAWVPDSTDVMPWIQVNLQQMKNVTGIVTQGWQGSYVKQYYVSYSEHGRNWRNHTVQGMTKVLQANVDDSAHTTSVLSPSVTAQFIRVHPINWFNKCALRMELYGCNISSGLPGQPSRPIAVSISSNEITVKWTPPTDTGSSAIKGYNIQWKVDGQSSHQQKIVLSQTTAKLSNIKPYTLYNIQVQAFNEEGAGPWSVSLIVKSAESAPSASPGNFNLLSSSSLSLDVSWQAIPVEKQNGKLLGYRILYKKAGSQMEKVKEVGPNTLTYKLVGLEFVEYVVRVMGYNGRGNGPVTNPLRRFPLEGAPSPPRNLQLTVLSSKSIKAAWVEPEKMNGNFKQYVVTYRIAQDNVNERKMSSTTECVLENLEEFTEYYVRVHAETTISGNSSAIKQAKTLEDVPGSSPTIDSKETEAEDAHTIRVKWYDIREQDRNGDILGYRVFYNVLGQGRQLNKTIDSDQQNTVIIRKLKPYTEYCIKVVGFTKVGPSPLAGRCFIVRTSEAGPSEPRNVVVQVISSTSISVKWTEPALKNGKISKYIISYGLTLDDFKGEMEVTGNTMEGVLSGLMKFRTYYIKVRGKTSLPGNASNIMNATTLEDSPSAPVRFRGQAVSARDILLSWGVPLEPNGIIRYYYIRTYNSITGQQTNNLVNKSTVMQSFPGMGWSHFISNLKPYRNYTFTVQAVTVSPGDYANCTVMTQEGEPSGPRDVTAMLVNGGISVTWKDPEEYNGILLKYIVYYDGKRTYNSSFQDKGRLVLLTSHRQVFIAKEKLRPGTSYTVYVKASTRKGPGESSHTVTVQTPSEAPPPPDDPRVAGGDVKPTSITVYLKPSSQSNGKVIAHELVVEMPRRISKRETDSLPAEIHNYKVAKQNGERFYIAAWLEGSQLPQVFVLGDGKLYGGYHNAPLQPETKYTLYVRGVTEADGKWIYGEPAAVSLPPTGAEAVAKGRDDIVGVIAGVIGALVLAIIVIVALILYRRSNRPLNANLDVENQKRKRREFELRRLGAKKKALAAAGDAANEPELPPVMLDQFAKHVTKLHKSDDRGFMIEYTKLDSGRDYPSEAAFQQENKTKNRYGNIVPYDHSRVVLSTVEESPGSDYINASRVDGYNKPNAYIASQGPVPPSFGDFWRMVWEQRSSTIVMLTNLQERHKLKCHKYWPDETEEYGDITVTLVKSEYYSDYKIRTFHVKRESEKEERQVKQFHFTVWPDHGVPEYPTALLAFRRRVRAYNPPDAGPAIVHCSAGVGRTGTYIVIDSMLDRIKAENSLDIFNFVAYLRTRRIAMVQTEEQYTFCHDAILESVQCGNTQIYAHDLRIALARMDEVSTDTKMTRFESEFKTLNKVSPVLQKGSYIVASYPENKEKNRIQEILASDCSRVVLTAIDDNEATSYINAVHISGYKQQHAFIVTQYPLKSTLTDFWRMLCEHDSSCVVLFHADEEEGDFPQLWPETDTATYDDMISVQCLSANRSSVDNLKSNYDQSEITEKMAKATDLRTPEKSLRIKMFEFSGWANENEVPSCSALIALTAKVEKWQQHSGNGPITVVCSDGFGRSGTFCALYSVLERLKIEQVVDVFQAIKAMRIPRPGLVRTWAEYRFIHYTVQEYLSAFDDYANFKA